MNPCRHEKKVGAPKLFTFTRFPESLWKSIRTSNAIVVRQTRHDGLHEAFKRRIKTQIALPPERVAGGGNRRDVVLGFAGVGADNHPQDRRLAKTSPKGPLLRSLTSPHDRVTSSRWRSRQTKFQPRPRQHLQTMRQDNGRPATRIQTGILPRFSAA